MLREQRIMERIKNEMGEELNEYIATFNGCDFWKIREGEIIVNKTFKRLLNIVADFNLTTADELLLNAFELPEDKEVMLFMLPALADQYVTSGGDSLLNRMMVFCFILHFIVETEDGKITATDVLEQSANSTLMYKKESMWQKIKYTFGFANLPYRVRGNTRAIGLMSILSGKSGQEMTRDIGLYYDLI